MTSEGAARYKGIEWSCSCNQALRVLDLGEGVRELMGRLFKTIDRVAKKEIRSSIEGKAEEEVADVDGLAWRAWKGSDQGLRVSFETVQVGDAIFDELGSEKLA